MSDHLFDVLRPAFQQLIPDDRRYAEAFVGSELLMALLRMHGNDWPGTGQFMWRGNDGFDLLGLIRSRLDELAADWAPLKAGMFDGNPDHVRTAIDNLAERLRGSW